MTERTWSTTESDVVRVANANDQIQAGIGEPLMCEGQVVLCVDRPTDERPWHLPARRVRVGRPSSGCGAFRKEQPS